MAPRGRGRRGRGGRLDRDGDVSMGSAGSGQPNRPHYVEKGPRTDREGDVTMGVTGNGKTQHGHPERPDRGGRASRRGGINKDKNKSRSKSTQKGRDSRIVDAAKLQKHAADGAAHKEKNSVGGVSKDGQILKDKFMKMLDKRYDADRKLLDLSRLGQDPEFEGTGMFDVARAGKFFLALMTVCDQAFTSEQHKRESVQSVGLAGNQLSNLKDVASLAQTFPDLKNLDLSDNDLQMTSDLNPFRRKFKSLEMLYLAGCPITDRNPDYRNEFKKWFPSIQFIDGRPVQMELPPGYGATLPGKSEDQIRKESLEIELMLLTRLKLPFAQECLESTSYIPQRALEAFQQAKPQLAPEAFF